MMSECNDRMRHKDKLESLELEVELEAKNWKNLQHMTRMHLESLS